MSLADLTRVHGNVLSNFTWKPDLEVFGKIEHWDRPVKIDGHLYGDCDEFAIECWYRLKELGYEPHLAVCSTVGSETKINHCVCICIVPNDDPDSEDEWYVLDNRERRPVKLTDTFYTAWARDNGNWQEPWTTFEIEDK